MKKSIAKVQETEKNQYIYDEFYIVGVCLYVTFFLYYFHVKSSLCRRFVGGVSAVTLCISSFFFCFISFVNSIADAGFYLIRDELL